ncbi:MAG: hypothetical protein H0V11_06100, partial [Actinobacteria bacterium]|nr:hypothetical protein [Actinomycetota bacterium]
MAVQEQTQAEHLAEQYERLARETPGRQGVDVAIRALDISLAALFALVALPAMVVIAAALLLTSGRPLFY